MGVSSSLFLLYVVVLLSDRAVWLSHSYPSPISLKLRDIQETVKANGSMDADTLNFAIRKLVRENHECLGSKHYVNTDFAVSSSSILVNKCLEIYKYFLFVCDRVKMFVPTHFTSFFSLKDTCYIRI